MVSDAIFCPLQNLTTVWKILMILYSYMKALLYKHGFGYVWEANTVGDINRFVDVFKQRLKDCCLQAWHSDICESPKSIHYSKF